LKLMVREVFDDVGVEAEDTEFVGAHDSGQELHDEDLVLERVLLVCSLAPDLHEKLMDLPYRCKLSYSLSPKVWGSCNNSRAGKLGVASSPSAWCLRLWSF
jgi:hypothetical protein